jgi:hypothetical protein
MKTRLMIVLVGAVLAILVIVLFGVARPLADPTGGVIPVTGDTNISSSSIQRPSSSVDEPLVTYDDNNPLRLLTDPSLNSHVAGLDDASTESRPLMPFDFNNPLGLSTDPWMDPNATPILEKANAETLIPSQTVMPFDFNNPSGLPLDPWMDPNAVNPSDAHAMDEQYRQQYQITDPTQ